MIINVQYENELVDCKIINPNVNQLIACVPVKLRKKKSTSFLSVA